MKNPLTNRNAWNEQGKDARLNDLDRSKRRIVIPGHNRSYYIGEQSTSFTTAGNHNWVCPDINRVFWAACSGGTGGTAGTTSTLIGYIAASSGGATTQALYVNYADFGGVSGYIWFGYADVRPFTTYVMTVGAGGAVGGVAGGISYLFNGTSGFPINGTTGSDACGKTERKELYRCVGYFRDRNRPNVATRYLNDVPIAYGESGAWGIYPATTAPGAGGNSGTGATAGKDGGIYLFW